MKKLVSALPRAFGGQALSRLSSPSRIAVPNHFLASPARGRADAGGAAGGAAGVRSAMIFEWIRNLPDTWEAVEDSGDVGEVDE